MCVFVAARLGYLLPIPLVSSVCIFIELSAIITSPVPLDVTGLLTLEKFHFQGAKLAIGVPYFMAVADHLHQR